MKRSILIVILAMFFLTSFTYANKKVSIVDVTGNELLFIVNLGDDMSFNEFYTFQYENIDFSSLANYSNFELVSIAEKEIVIQSGSTILKFNLSADNSSNIQYQGYGIAINKSVSGYELKKPSRGNIGDVILGKEKKVKDTNGNTLSCDSGGPGSSQCGTRSGMGTVDTECSVTCNSGYYSCCDDGQGKCGCVKSGMTKSGVVNIMNNLNYYSCN